MLIRSADRGSEVEWRAFLAAHAFGQLVAGGRDRDLPVVVPTQFVVNDDEIVLHLARPNPIWDAVEENDQVVLSVAGDWAYIPSAWKVIGDEDPRAGIPTTYYAAVQIVGTARIVDDPDHVAALLREQLADVQPEVDVLDPIDHGAKLGAIRGLRISIREVRSKFKYGGNVDAEHRLAVADRLAERDGPGDAVARRHLLDRMEGDQ
ncbi:MAG: FMN-binding negative transcriptional regulator [Acidimicrobiia bacterium]|nr:FMN-binding negative transcriptional regulator [Acidimicrobiia bacterium]